MLTRKEKRCISEACEEYKKIVSRPGPDAIPGLLAKYSIEEFYKTVVGNDGGEEFKNTILTHPFFTSKGYKTLCDIYSKEQSLFMYCLQKFLSDRLLIYYDNITAPNQNSIEVNPDTMEVINKETKSTINTKKEYVCPDCEEVENKKEFIKEVLDGVEHKKTLKEFLTDPRSYKQFRDDVDKCLLCMDWEKIHRAMKKLKWKWHQWIDEYGNVHNNTVPSVSAIREHVYDMIKHMEDWIMENGDEDRYLSGTGGFEYEMRVCEDNDVDDYNHRVRFVVRFVIDKYDNGM